MSLHFSLKNFVSSAIIFIIIGSTFQNCKTHKIMVLIIIRNVLIRFEIYIKKWIIIINIILVFSHAPWCPACKDLQKAWNSFAEWSKDLNIKVAEVDVTINPGLSGRFLVTALPTIYQLTLFYFIELFVNPFIYFWLYFFIFIRYRYDL